MLKTIAGASTFLAISAIIATASATATPTVKVVKGAKPLTQQEKASVSGKCGCVPAPSPSPVVGKPGYGFGTTGHYGPPGQGFTPSDNWRNHAAGDGKTPSGKDLPPTAFN